MLALECILLKFCKGWPLPGGTGPWSHQRFAILKRTSEALKGCRIEGQTKAAHRRKRAGAKAVAPGAGGKYHDIIFPRQCDRAMVQRSKLTTPHSFIAGDQAYRTLRTERAIVSL